MAFVSLRLPKRILESNRCFLFQGKINIPHLFFKTMANNVKMDSAQSLSNNFEQKFFNIISNTSLYFIPLDAAAIKSSSILEKCQTL